MTNDTLVYISALQKSLAEKLQVLEKMYSLTKEQNDILSSQMDSDRFDMIVDKKDVLLQEISKLDVGFDRVYGQVGNALQLNPEKYREQIIDMQKHIQLITDMGVKIQALEYKNRELFDMYISGERKNIKAFYDNSKMANSYHQNMANQHRQWQTYFLDQKK